MAKLDVNEQWKNREQLRVNFSLFTIHYSLDFSMVVLNAILDILANNFNAKYKDICDAIGVPVRE